MVQIQTQPGVEEKFKQLYGMLTLKDKPEFSDAYQNGNLAEVALRYFNSEQVRQQFDDISEIVDQCIPVEGECIILNNCNGSLYCQQNESNGDKRSYQRVYQKEELADNYKLWVVAAEREHRIIDGSLDMGIYIIDKDNSIVFNVNFKYETNNRLNYKQLVNLMSERLKKQLNHSIQDPKNKSVDSLKEVFKKVIDVDDLIMAVHLYGSRPLQLEKYIIVK